MAERKFYTCKNDVAFKEVFMKEENSLLLKGLIEDCLNIEVNKITYLNNEQIVGNVHVKGKRFDIFLDTNIGKIQLEMNANYNKYYRPRNTAYICNTYSYHTLKGDYYNEDIMVMQLNFTYGIKDDLLCREYKIMDKYKKLFIKNFIIYEFNMDKYEEICYNKENSEIKNHKYLVILDRSIEELYQLSKKDKEIKMYMEQINKVNQDPEFQEFMSAEEDARKIYNSEIRYARQIGMEQGLKEGIEQ